MYRKPTREESEGKACSVSLITAELVEEVEIAELSAFISPPKSLPPSKLAP